MILVIDCKDSFVYNLVACFRALGNDTTIMSEESIDVHAVESMDPDAIVLSPGPGRPGPCRGSWKVLEHYIEEKPFFGVCLGHQTICSILGSEVYEAGPVHGKIVPIHHDGRGLFEGIPDGFSVVRYNSLCVCEQSLSNELKINARDSQGDIMAVSHNRLPLFGVQFHPESFLSEHGTTIISNFIREVRR